jgi:hypothetical protein
MPNYTWRDFPSATKQETRNARTPTIIEMFYGCQDVHSVKATFGRARYMVDFKKFPLNCKQLNVLHISLPPDDDGRYPGGSSWIDENDEPGVKSLLWRNWCSNFPAFIDAYYRVQYGTGVVSATLKLPATQ